MFGIDLAVHKGEIISVIGANGAGKSTLMLTLIGAITAKSGKVVLQGRDVTVKGPEQRVELGIALCPEGRRIFQHLSVEENIIVAMVPQRSLPQAQTLSGMYELFPVLYDKRHDRAGSLSGGQQQMLAIARALASRPNLLLLDEPSLGLAPKIVMAIFERLVQLQENGLTLIIVDQNVELALDVSDYGYVMESGRVRLEGPAAKLRADAGLIEAFL